MITITDNAADRIIDLIIERDNVSALRVFVQGGGCSGFNYGFAFAEEINDEDEMIENGDATIVIDPMSLPYLEGATIDYKSDIAGSMFTISNPNATTTCGCGQSFST